MAGTGDKNDGKIEMTATTTTAVAATDSGGGADACQSLAAGAGQDLVPTTPTNTSVVPTSDHPTHDGAAATTTPPRTNPASQDSTTDGDNMTPLPTNQGPLGHTLPEPTIPDGGAAITPLRTTPGPSGPTIQSDAATGNQSEDLSLVPVGEPTETATPPTGAAATVSSLTPNAATLLALVPTEPGNTPAADPDGVMRRPRSKRGRPQESLTFGPRKHEAIHNLTLALPPPPPAVDERTPPPTKKIRDGKGIASSSSSSPPPNSPPPPSPFGAANTDSQILRHRKDRDGNVRWYFSSAGSSSSTRKSNLHLIPPPPPPLFQQPVVQGPQLPYPCSICGRGFYSLRSLCGHMKAHPGRVWRGAFPPPDNIFPVLALPVQGHDNENAGGENNDGSGNIEDAVMEGENNDGSGNGDAVMEGENNDGSGNWDAAPELNVADENAPVDDADADAAVPDNDEAAAVPPAAGADEEVAAGDGKNPLGWDLNGPPPTDSDEDMQGGDQ